MMKMNVWDKSILPCLAQAHESMMHENCDDVKI